MGIVEDILRLKKKRRAVILAHNYQRPEVQDIADFVGDSLGLSIQASGTAAEVIVFCGVRFMAETAKIVSPGKTVLLPDMDALCPLADMITAEDITALRREHEGAKILCYVNTSAQVKAGCDTCCTSANAASVVKELTRDGSRLVFVPDGNLAEYASEQACADVVSWGGFCPTHTAITAECIVEAKNRHPDAVVYAHPECTREVRRLADRILSTEGMCWYAREEKGSEVIVATETGILHRLRRENPGKRFFAATEEAFCPNMKRVTLEKILQALEWMEPEIVLPREVIHGARRCLRGLFMHRS